MSQSPTPVRLAVLNPGGRDPFVDYADGPGVITPGVHAPINFHAYAAATRGAFFDSTEAVLKAGPRFTAVLVLIRRRVWISLQAVRRLKAAGHTVLVAWKECGPYQITEQLRSSRVLESYQEILSLADGILSPTVAPPPRWGWMTAGISTASAVSSPRPTRSSSRTGISRCPSRSGTAFWSGRASFPCRRAITSAPWRWWPRCPTG